MQKSGFFTSESTDGVQDRRYSADDMCDIFSAFIGNGVRSGDLQVYNSGTAIYINPGWAMINGHYYHNTENLLITNVTRPASGTRHDSVVITCDTSAQRECYVQYKTGVTGSAAYPAPERTDTVYEIVLAHITVSSSTTTITITDTRSDTTLCGITNQTSEATALLLQQYINKNTIAKGKGTILAGTGTTANPCHVDLSSYGFISAPVVTVTARVSQATSAKTLVGVTGETSTGFDVYVNRDGTQGTSADIGFSWTAIGEVG